MLYEYRGVSGQESPGLIAGILIMISSLILGMGLPATAAYVLAVAAGGPALIKMGGELLSVLLYSTYEVDSRSIQVAKRSLANFSI
jgi:hypothetical protein